MCAGGRRLATAVTPDCVRRCIWQLPVVRAQYERLRAAGKPEKVARCAAARKLLLLAYAVVTKKRPFDPRLRVGEGAVVEQVA